MTKKAFRGFIAVLIVVVLLAVGWLIGWGITGNLNPVDWGKNQTQPEKENETVVGSIIGENINKYAKVTSARTSAVENRGNSTIDFGTLVGDRADIYIKIGVVVRTCFPLLNSSFAYYRDNSVLTSVKLTSHQTAELNQCEEMDKFYSALAKKIK